MRLIDADALKAYVNSLSTHPLNEWDTWGVLAAIDKQPTVNPWHRVEEELPAKQMIVIACNECEIVQCAYLENNGRWYAANNQTWDSWTFMPYVTHWMPLPEPPQEITNE